MQRLHSTYFMVYLGRVASHHTMSGLDVNISTRTRTPYDRHSWNSSPYHWQPCHGYCHGRSVPKGPCLLLYSTTTNCVIVSCTFLFLIPSSLVISLLECFDPLCYSPTYFKNSRCLTVLLLFCTSYSCLACSLFYQPPPSRWLDSV